MIGSHCLVTCCFLVELRGFEPLTPSMRTRCATGLRYSPRVASQRSKSGVLPALGDHQLTRSAYRAVRRMTSRRELRPARRQSPTARTVASAYWS
jgi:hypothetical protein